MHLHTFTFNNDDTLIVMASSQCWLMKAEPDPRIVKGKDVKFNVDDFESVKTTSWEGVRNHQAKNYMKAMQVGDKVLFYHSNCKTPGIAGFAHVVKEAHPDYTAWDPSHPYYDPKSVEEKPRWFMVDVEFDSRAAHYVPLAILREIAGSGCGVPGVEYIGPEGVAAVKGMELVNRGRLSVQKVEEAAYEVIQKMAEQGGWDLNVAKKSRKRKREWE